MATQGTTAETLATILLWLKGYEILAKNYRNRLGEIDIIAKKHKTIIAIEVKKRKNIDKAKYSIMFRQQGRIKNSILYYIKTNKKYKDFHIRFDAIVFSAKYVPKHIKNAWN